MTAEANYSGLGGTLGAVFFEGCLAGIHAAANHEIN